MRKRRTQTISTTLGGSLLVAVGSWATWSRNYRRGVAAAVLALFLGGLVVSTAGELLSSHVHVAQAGHLPAAPNADSGDSEGPCGPDCACLCCPGHRVTVAFSAVMPVLAAPPLGALLQSLPADLHPSGINQPVFHPPRT